MPYFSVIMPTFNREKMISNPIRSLINQPFQDWELIIIDDHGEDNTKSVVESFKDHRIKYFFLESNLGPSGARNFGINKSKGKVILLADSDDIILKDRLNLTAQAFKENQEINIIYGNEYIVHKDGIRTLRPNHEFSPELLKYYNYIANPTTAYKKDLFYKIGGYDENLRTSEDYDFWLSALEKGEKFLLINRPLVEQTIHAGSILFKTRLEDKRKNLVYVREKHKIPTPNFKDVKKLVQNQKLLNYISTPEAISFWFN